MKTFTIFLLAFLFITITDGAAQHIFKSDNILGYELKLYNITFEPGKVDSHPIALRKYGLKQQNYSILIKATVKDDSTLYALPGQLQSGDSFGFKVKVGNRQTGDTITVYRRSGDQTLTFQQIRLLIFRQKNRRGVLKENHEFTKFIVSNFIVPVPHSPFYYY